MKQAMMAMLAIALLTSAAWALDVHADYRFAAGECRTWGSGKYKSATIWVRVYEKYDFKTSNYPVASEYRFVCQYDGEADPMASKPGEYMAKLGTNCTAKTVLVDGMPKTSFPVLTGGYSVDYNAGWSMGQVWCKYDPWYYGAPPAPVTTTTMTTMPPPPTMPTPLP